MYMHVYYVCAIQMIFLIWSVHVHVRTCMYLELCLVQVVDLLPHGFVREQLHGQLAKEDAILEILLQLKC